MKKFISIILLIGFRCAFAQGEANIWYFGEYAGLDFNSGSPVALTNGQMNTGEGCSVLSNSMGQLIFYTNGVTVYNKNHQVMVNGTGLMGDDSTTQSSVIIQKPGSTNLYYIFTLDNEINADGFRYSIVDMNLDSGLGAVTSDKNVLIYTPSCEKMSMVKHSNNSDYWIVTHGWNNNTFYSHLLTASGLNPTPVLSNVGNNIPLNNIGISTAYAGALKISPDGSKIACTNEKHLELFDFDKATGILSNPNIIYVEPFWSASIIGLEFSIDNKILYATSNSRLLQFNLLANPISSSLLVVGESNSFLPLALQLGPDNKIYVAKRESSKLGVINYPTTLGLGCNFQDNVIDLGGKICYNGLPNFCQSFFIPLSINVSNNCANDLTSFSISPNLSILSATWNFGDGNTSNIINPTHTYISTGNYIVSVQIVTPQGTTSTTKSITIYPKPILLQNIINLKQCDDDNDGFSAFNLTQSNQLLVTSTTGLYFSYFSTFAEAQSNSNSISNIMDYVNTIVSSSQVFVRVTNTNGCYSIATINLIVSTTLIPASFQRTFTNCDDEVSGSNTDGISNFNFSSVTSEILSLYPPNQVLEIKYYKNLMDALAEQNYISNTTSFINTVPNQQNIYIRVDSVFDNACIGLGHHITLKVEPKPIIQPISYRNCDDNHDGITAFNTSHINTTLLNSLSNVVLSFWDQNNIPLPSPLPNPFFTTSQTVKVRATNLTASACFYETYIIFTVDDLPEIFPIPSNLTTKCDDEINPNLQDGLYSFDTTNFQNLLLGSQLGMIVKYFDANGNSLPSPLPNPFLSGTQNITVEIFNTLNNNCKVNGTISLIVNPIPNIVINDNELICSDNTLFTKIIDAGINNNANIINFTYQWFKDGELLPSEQNHQLIVNSQGEYKVIVSNLLGCTTTRIITVKASNKAKIVNIEVIDFSEENSITILVSGLGIYEYSLDDINYQTSNTFNNLDSGIFNIYVKDTKGCGIISENVSVLGASKFFTPNGDSYNDYWNIKGINKQIRTIESIDIYDKYGRLLIQVNPYKKGWDGTYNGNPMPATDYWYVIKLISGKIVKGHFSLKR